MLIDLIPVSQFSSAMSLKSPSHAAQKALSKSTAKVGSTIVKVGVGKAASTVASLAVKAGTAAAARAAIAAGSPLLKLLLVPFSILGVTR